jgi:hypothetical protein
MMRFNFYGTAETKNFLHMAQTYLEMARMLASESHLAFRAFGHVSLFPTPHEIWGKHLGDGVIRFGSPQLLDFHMTLTSDGERVVHVDVSWSIDSEDYREVSFAAAKRTYFVPKHPSSITVHEIKDPLIRIQDDANPLLFVEFRHSDLASKVTADDLVAAEDVPMETVQFDV